MNHVMLVLNEHSLCVLYMYLISLICDQHKIYKKKQVDSRALLLCHLKYKCISI